MKILGIETSCDETSAAVIDEQQVYSNVVSSQAVHLQFGGVVPELASRAHLRKIIPIVDEALARARVGFDELDGMAVTCGPGLVGALLVGINYVKGISVAEKIPFAGVNHVEGHVYSILLENEELQPPFLCLIVSGGHTQIALVKEHLRYKIIGATRDDAVGEAFDKVGKLLNLSYPGGPEIDKLAQQGNPEFVRFPRGLEKDAGFDFSYSGLKTAVKNFLDTLSSDEIQRHLHDICASFQKAAIEILVEKTIRAARTFQISQIGVAGGVAANTLLRKRMQEKAGEFHLQVTFPRMEYCTDNAAMIARAGMQRMKQGLYSDLDLNAYPSLKLGDAI